AGPLLRDWDWLQEQVIPPLLRSRGPRPARTWSIGSTADAVAVTVAFAHAAGARSHGFRAFVSDPFPDSGTVSFGRSDVGLVPLARRSTWFRCEDHRWVPEPVIADHVIMGQPPGSVDLVTVRHADRPARWHAALDRLKRGGHLLFVEPSGDVPAHLRPVDADGRLFKK